MPVTTSVRTGLGAELNPESDYLIDLLRQGSHAGGFDIDDPATTGNLLYAAIHGAAHDHLLLDDLAVRESGEGTMLSHGVASWGNLNTIVARLAGEGAAGGALAC